MVTRKAKRIPVPLSEQQYDAVKAIGAKEDRPMAYIIAKALDEWLDNHAEAYPDILAGRQQSIFNKISDSPVKQGKWQS